MIFLPVLYCDWPVLGAAGAGLFPFKDVGGGSGQGSYLRI